MSKLRRCKPADSRKLGLLAGPHKHVIQVKNDTGTVKTILIDPTVFNKLMAKRSLSQKGSGSSTPSKTKPDGSVVTVPAKIEPSEEKMDVDETDNKSTSEEVTKEIKAEEEEAAPPPKEEDEAKTTPEPEISEQPSSMNVDDTSKETKVEDATPTDEPIPDKPSEAALTPKAEPEDEPPIPDESSTPLKTEVKEEQTESSLPKSSDAPPGLGVARKFRTDLVNVSLGIVSANRILYPKIAHKSVILENLLARRIALQQREEAELLETYGKEKLETVQAILDNGGKIPSSSPPEEINNEVEEVLEDSFPLAGIYRYTCYSYMCQSAAEEFRKQNKTTVRQHEYACYSPMCRLKFYVQDSNRRKEERAEALRTARMAALVEEVVGKRMFTQVS